MTDVDDAIATYRRRVQAEAELAEGDLDELEEHLRALTDELRTAGMSAAEAVSEATRRLGEPRQLAREHTRVRSRFGAPLSAGRALSAGVLFAVRPITLIVELAGASGPSVPLRVWLHLGAFVMIAIALAARRTWARPVALGLTGSFLTLMLLHPHLIDDPAYWIFGFGALAFAVPWSRKELSPAAIALSLQAWAYASAWCVLNNHVIMFDDALLIAPACGLIALVGASAACIGTVLRARWSTIASAVTALAMSCVLGEILVFQFTHGVSEWRSPGSGSWLGWHIFFFSAVASGAIAACIAAIRGGRITRSPVDRLQPLRR